MGLLVLSTPVGAQSIRGTVVDDGSKLPIPSVHLTLVDDAGAEVPPGVYSDSLGAFIVHAARAGSWRVKAMRIGYGPITSDPVSLLIGGLAVVRLRMTPVAQQLIPVQVVEQRPMTAAELMSATGFDLRERRGLGKFLSGERLAGLGQYGVREVLATQFQPILYVDTDPVLGDVLRIRQGIASCEPEVYLDGRLLATAPEPAAVSDGPPPLTAIDSMRAQMRIDSERLRVNSGQMYALSLLSSLTANSLHGIELYRSNEIPPTSLGAWFGMTRASIRPCGTVAIWTKAGMRSQVTARNVTAPGRAIQVISGTLVDFDTGTPLAGRTVMLLTESKDAVGAPVVTDERGDFTMRTGRAGTLRLTAGGNEYLVSTTPAFDVAANEMMVVKLFVSAKQGVLAPLGVAARVLPQHIGLTSLAGFTYRRERAQGGTFFRATDIERMGARSLDDAIRSATGGAPRCAPAYYVDGTRLTGDARPTIAALPVSRVFGVEVYTREADIPMLYVDQTTCGVVVIWTKP